MSLPSASLSRSPQHGRATLPLHEALVKLRLRADEDEEQLKVGDAWDLGKGLGVVLLAKPSSLYTPARLAATATASATALPAWLLGPLSTHPAPIPHSSTPPPPPRSRSAPASSHGIAARHRHTSVVALCDFFARRLHAAVVSSPTASANGIHSDYNSGTVGQFVLETNRATISPTTGNVSVVFELLPASGIGEQRLRTRQKQQPGGKAPATAAGEQRGGEGVGAEIEESVRGVIERTLLSRDHSGGGLEAEDACAHVKSVEDQRHLRDLVAASDGIAFVADGSVLPRRSGSDDRPMEAARGAVPFESPESLRREFSLPHRGVVKGMLVPRGVTVIVGGGYHGKSTLLRALAVGVYDKVPGDGRELAVTDPGAVTVRAEDGRPVSGVDISPFISSLPASTAVSVGKATSAVSSVGREGAEGGSNANGNAAAVAGSGHVSSAGGGSNAEEVVTERFSSGGASGSTSQAANVVEALEAGATALLLDEDTCAGNFMIRDSRMRAMVHHEPITPFIYRVSSLWLELGVSSVIVVGGCGDYFDVHNTAILVDNYTVSDATERAHSISRRFCVGRVQYAGRGLVHRLPWPDPSSPRAIVPESVLGPYRKASVVPGTKRKRGCDSRGADGADVATAKEGRAGGGRADAPSNGSAPGHNRNGHSSPSARGAANGSKPSGAGEQADAGQHREFEGVPPPTQADGAQGVCQRESCECPCFCGRRDPDTYSSTADTGNRAITRVGTASADLSRVEQLVGGAAMVRGCALGVRFVARATEMSPGLSVSGALDLLDAATAARDNEGIREGKGAGEAAKSAEGGLVSLFSRGGEGPAEGREGRDQAAVMGPFCGGPLVALPRRFEVAAALYRLPGVKFRPAAGAVVAVAEPAMSSAEAVGGEI